MPTTHRRHVITEADDISNALDIARRTWPDLADKPGALLRQLAVDATAGALDGVFRPGYLSELREQDWPSDRPRRQRIDRAFRTGRRPSS
jgi:hypothetical protein